MSANTVTVRRPGTRVGAAMALALFATAACGDHTLVEPEPELIAFQEVAISANCEPIYQEVQMEASFDDGSSTSCDGGGGTYDTSYDYGSYSYDGGYSTTWDVDYYQTAAHSEDMYAFDPYMTNFDDTQALALWAPAVVGGLRAAVAVGRAVAQTSRIRSAVTQGARWARDVTAAVAAAMLVGNWQMAHDYVPEDIPVSEFDFMFDYAIQ